MIQVRITFDDGTYNYTLPYIFHVIDPKEGIKSTVISGTRGAGSIIIPGGRKSQEIIVKGKLIDNDGYVPLTILINEMKTKVTTSPATLTMKHNVGAGWVTNWQYYVRRIEEIKFPQSLRTASQEYMITFLVTSYV